MSCTEKGQGIAEPRAHASKACIASHGTQVSTAHQARTNTPSTCSSFSKSYNVLLTESNSASPATTDQARAPGRSPKANYGKTPSSTSKLGESRTKGYTSSANSFSHNGNHHKVRSIGAKASFAYPPPSDHPFEVNSSQPRRQ